MVVLKAHGSSIERFQLRPRVFLDLKRAQIQEIGPHQTSPALKGYGPKHRDDDAHQDTVELKTLTFVLPEGMHLPANTIGINATAQAHRRSLRAQIHRKPATNKLWLSQADLSIGSLPAF